MVMKNALFSQPPSKALLWRASLQAILVEALPELQPGQARVGRLARRSANFADYALAAFKKLNLPSPFTADELEARHAMHVREHGHRLAAFYQTRSLLAGVVEGLILLDRLVFLMECGVPAAIMRLFDPVVSPRCHAIVALKNTV